MEEEPCISNPAFFSFPHFFLFFLSNPTTLHFLIPHLFLSIRHDIKQSQIRTQLKVYTRLHSPLSPHNWVFARFHSFIIFSFPFYPLIPMDFLLRARSPDDDEAEVRFYLPFYLSFFEIKDQSETILCARYESVFVRIAGTNLVRQFRADGQTIDEDGRIYDGLFQTRTRGYPHQSEFLVGSHGTFSTLIQSFLSHFLTLFIILVMRAPSNI